MALYKVDSDTADLTKVSGGTLYADNPIGSILPYGGAVAPSGWFICQGQAISRTTYAELFAVIGTTFGSGNGSTTFNLPDLRNKAVMGAGTNGALGASQRAQLPNITGKIDNKSGTFGIMGFSSGTSSFSGALKGSEAKGAVYTGQQNTSACKVVTFDASYSGASTDINGNNVYTNNGETRPANVRCNFIIKAKHTPVPADFMDAVEEAIDTSNIAKMLPYSFNMTSNVGAFNRQFVYQGHALTWTATHTGRLTLRLLKHGDGYSLYLGNQNGMLDTYDNFFGSDSQGTGVSDASITLSAYVKKGDAIRLESNLPSTTPRADTFFCQTGLLAYNNNYD